MIRFKLIILLLVLSLFATTGWTREEQTDAVWQATLKKHFFADREILDGTDILTLEAPKRAEDGAVVPVRISAGFPQTTERHIKTVTLIIDKNPSPLAGKFHFTPKSGKVDLSLRIRVNEYSPVRVIAETNDGKLHMIERFVKASGGCSAPAGTDIDAAMARLGKMRFKIRDNDTSDNAVPVRLAISHPNLTGLQKDQVSLLFIPSHFIRKIHVNFEGEPIFSAETDISVSENPNFGFFFVPEKPGKLQAEIEDSKGMKFTKVITYSPEQVQN